MPKDPTIEISKVPYHKMELNSSVYLFGGQAGPIFAVVSLFGIKSNPAAYTEMARVNSYVDAVKDIFPAKVRGKDAIAKFTLVGNKTLNGHAGREYKLTIGDLSGTAQVFATKKRFYAIIFLDTKKDDSLRDRFLSSFTLPEKIKEPAVTVAVQNPPRTTAAETAPANSTKAATTTTPEAEAAAAADATPDAKTGDASTPAGQSGQRKPISGGVLNGKALALPKPDYPAEARNAGASGTVVVQVTIDEQGNVIAAHAVSGHPLLQAVSVNAARQAKFAPTSLMGEAVKVTGVITYNFAQ